MAPTHGKRPGSNRRSQTRPAWHRKTDRERPVSTTPGLIGMRLRSSHGSCQGLATVSSFGGSEVDWAGRKALEVLLVLVGSTEGLGVIADRLSCACLANYMGVWVQVQHIPPCLQ